AVNHLLAQWSIQAKQNSASAKTSALADCKAEPSATKPQPASASQLLQRTYDEKDWGEEGIISNVQATDAGSGVYNQAQAAAGKLGLTLKVLVDDGAQTGYTIINQDLKMLICVIPGKESEGEATQILVQELSNAANKAELDVASSQGKAQA